MKKKQPETNPDPQLRREALASDVEAFLKSGNSIEQIPSGVSAQANLKPANHRSAQNSAPAAKQKVEPASEDPKAPDEATKPAS